MQVAAGRSRPQRRSGSVPFLQGLKEPDRLVEAEAMTIEDYRGLLMERRAARVEPDDVGGLGGKCGIIALAPGFPPGKVDLVRPRLRRQHLEGVAGMWRFTAATST
jgi:hypothetical protein